jgi:hypothetical protein
MHNLSDDHFKNASSGINSSWNWQQLAAQQPLPEQTPMQASFHH